MGLPAGHERVHYEAIQPGVRWLDTDGEPIHAHGGSIFFEDGVFYWYGENKEHTKPGSGIWHWGVRCYSSTDLYNWTDEGLIIPPVTDDPRSPLHPARFLDRPHIIRNERTGRYVCWIKIMTSSTTAEAVVLTSERLLGPYRIMNEQLRPLGMNAGDLDLVVAPDDGKAYYYFERSHTELICADLTDDYTNVTGYYSTHFPRVQPPWVREAPAYFHRRGKHYLVTSGTTAYFPNPSEIAVADTYHGPWTVLGDLHPRDDTHTSYRSQIASVFKHPHKEDLYIALGDRWLPSLPPEQSNQTALFQRMFSGEESRERVAADAPPGLDDADTSIADYVWLPIRFDGDVPRIDWMDAWRIEDFV